MEGWGESGRRVPDTDDDVVIGVVADKILCRLIWRFPFITGMQGTSHSTFARGYKLFGADGKGNDFGSIPSDDRRSRRLRRHPKLCAQLKWCAGTQ
ncbi:hypothetical protein Y032_0247g45 [Ancylostoma ceylanicum]|uniref:Uncharacterized protein n=1 Tax=Ancylostoma ceylanicum TaxID=53326 RepID=A0A016SCN4_9BILA|nr:hypothetical protein Y032_0247g45 [Ancylostoma ceylanicum]